jgi:hypothetical protein
MRGSADEGYFATVEFLGPNPQIIHNRDAFVVAMPVHYFTHISIDGHKLLTPLSPALLYRAKINATFYFWTFSTTLNDGESFRVPMSVVHEADRSPQDLSAEWDSVFGPGYYKNKVLDAQIHLRGAASGSKGRVLQVELYKNEIRPIPSVQNDDSSVIEMNGIAKDGPRPLRTAHP